MEDKEYFEDEEDIQSMFESLEVGGFDDDEEDPEFGECDEPDELNFEDR